MSSFVIEGGHRLSGEIHPQGAKNEALEVISAVLLTAEPVTITNVPEILDVKNLIDLLRGMGDAAPIMRAVEIRTAELPSGNDEYSRRRREVISEAKRRFALPAKTAAEKAAKDRELWGD